MLTGGRRMSKVFLSLNFMHCMERFATQIYRTQKGAFRDKQIIQQLIDASENERTHVQKFRTQIKKLNGKIYPLGWLFQFVGVILGLITRLCGKRNLFKADTFVEMRAVKDYNGFLKTIPFDKDTVNIIRVIIADEEVHIANWKKASELFAKKKPTSN
jgi:demethoxyubiquinone hydroxylase (CLK1/Coq7/Cat5 family)